jgi:hypothetical protein
MEISSSTPADYAYDCFHLSPVGQKRVAEGMFKYMREGK